MELKRERADEDVFMKCQKTDDNKDFEEQKTSSIYFSIHFLPDIEPLEAKYSNDVTSQLRQIKEKLGEYNIIVKECEFVAVQSGLDAPHVTETEVVVQAEVTCSTKENPYTILRTCWKKITTAWNKVNVALLAVSANEAFMKVRHPKHENVKYQTIRFGVFTFAGEYAYYLDLDSYNLMNFYHDIKKIEIKFLSIVEMTLEVPYTSIRRILVHNDIDNSVRVYLDLVNPPLLFRVENKFSKKFGEYKLNHRTLAAPPLTSSIIGGANVLQIVLSDRKSALEIISRLRYRCSQMPVFYGQMTDLVRPTVPSKPTVCTPYFSCNYLLSAIFQRNYTIWEQCRSNVFQMSKLSDLLSLSLNEQQIEKSLLDILLAIDLGKVIFFPTAVISLYSYYCAVEEATSFNHFIVPPKTKLIRRLVITPTRLLLYPPEVMFENRVLRNFNSEYAIRVTFRDDNMSRLSFNAVYASEDIFVSAVKNPMLRGLDIGSRHFSFLAWSNSQIRDHGVWMYARDDKGFDVAAIRRWMGDFSHIHSVPKYMARMGQCFSQTEDTVSVPLDEKHVRTEDDIEHGRDASSGKPYCFSDGIGRISVELSKKVHDALGHDKHCSAFQIRYGGYKGMLVTDPTLTDADIVFRNSMKKFQSPQNTRLEIARTSAPVPLHLNRPFITILKQLGVDESVFLKMQEDMLNALTDMLLEEKKAANFLRSKTPTGILKFREVAESGIGLTSEPFFHGLLLALHHRCAENLKMRANVDIDPNEGRNMLGVLDETGKLRYGEVFVQYTNDIELGESSKEATILKGTVLVTKNPCMFPGDVRKFQAVDIPELHHIIDCIVFPQNGSRPHPNEMAGSDLDGDEYVVLWKKSLIFAKPNYNPADFPSCPAPMNPFINDEDMINFLVEYIKKDQVGVIASAHLAHADKLGIFSQKCLAIAKKFSIAVDFSKNGAATDTFHLSMDEKAQSFPDFMERSYKSTYVSKKVLGKMYRVCKDFETETQYASTKYSHVQVDPSLIFPGWEKYESDAVKSLNKFSGLLWYMLQHYGVQHEAEVFSAAFTRLHSRYRERKDREEVEKVIVACVKALCKNMREEFFSEFAEKSSKRLLDVEMLKKASAWYIVTYRNKYSNSLSFPWIVSELLANVRMRNPSSSTVSLFPPLIVKLDFAIMNSAESDIIPVLQHEAVMQLGYLHFFCDRKVVEAALRVMIQWAIEMQIVVESGHKRGFLYTKVFIRLFLFIADKERYVSSSFRGGFNRGLRDVAELTSASLCLAFLRFCVSLRFHGKEKVKQLLPFEVYKHNKLAKQALLSYHQLAITGTLSPLSVDSAYKDVIEMKPEFIESSVFPIVPVPEAHLRRAEVGLTNFSAAEDDVYLREQCSNKKVIVSAFGTESSLLTLKGALRKEAWALREILGINCTLMSSAY